MESFFKIYSCPVHCLWHAAWSQPHGGPVWIPGETRKRKDAAYDGWLIQRASQWIPISIRLLYSRYRYECDSCIPHNRVRGTWVSGGSRCPHRIDWCVAL
jgi:hypothetical protein